MATHAPHFPDLLFAGAARLRRWEAAVLGLLSSRGYRELRPSLVVRSCPEGTEPMAVRFFDEEQLVALRWDFTRSLAGLLAARFSEPPPRVSYAGAVFRRPGQAWEATERFEVGCERIQSADESAEAADAELAELLLAIPALLGLRGGILQLGHAALLRKPLEAENVSETLRDQLVAAVSARALHRARAALSDSPIESDSQRRLERHLAALLEGPSALAESPYAELLADDLVAFGDYERQLRARLPPGLELRVDLADVRGFPFYSGPTIRLWGPGAREELAAGGRYDQLFPRLGRRWKAAGFCVRLTALLDLASTRPELFEDQAES
jgi:ATP phosphoribosyltransferase regulatory subunit